MMPKSVVLVGGHDSGKTNFVARLWISLKEHKGVLTRAGMPNSIEYIEAVCEHLLRGDFAGRTDRNMERQDFRVPIKVGGGEEISDLIVPDFTGELWESAVANAELPREWLDTLERADGALLFVRVHSDANVQPPDWVTARGLIENFGEENDDARLPTQVLLCELLRLLEGSLTRGPHGRKPRVAVVVTAWDLLDSAARSAGPREYLRRQFPLFAGALEDSPLIDVRVFGVSIVGGDLKRDRSFRSEYLGMEVSDAGLAVFEDEGRLHQDTDVTLPVAWAIGE